LYVLEGEKGKRRYHLDAHHAQHDPRQYLPSELRPVRLKLDGIQEGHVAVDGSRHKHFVKMADPSENSDSRNELAAYTVLGSIGFRVPHVSLV
jgi:hypothetical protein